MVSVRDFGAIGDGLRDDTDAFRRALASIADGGTLLVPLGRYRLTRSLELATGMVLVGESNADRTFGIPNPNARASYVFQETPGEAVFRIGGNTRQLGLSRLSLGARPSPDTTPVRGVVGIAMAGSYPNTSTDFELDAVQFYNFDVAIDVAHGPGQPPAAPDWQCDAVSLSHCLFFMNRTAVSFETENADAWRFANCQFASGSSSVHVRISRVGYLTFIDSFGGNVIGPPVDSFGILVEGDGLFDTIHILSSQWENMTSMIEVGASYHPNRPTGAMKLVMNASIAESEIVLGAACHYVSFASRYTHSVYVPGSDVTIDSYSDYFGPAAGLGYIVTGVNSRVQTAITASTTAVPQAQGGWVLGGRAERCDGAVPTSGGPHSRGDVVWNTRVAAGTPVGWVCVVPGSPGEWAPFGGTGGLAGPGSPVGVLVPPFVGAEYLDTGRRRWYKSVGLTDRDWVALS